MIPRHVVLNCIIVNIEVIPEMYKILFVGNLFSFSYNEKHKKGYCEGISK